MKKWLGVFMVFCMLFTMIQPFALAEGPTVVLDAAQVAQGDTEATVAVPISIRNNPGLLGLKVRVTYPEVLEVQNVAFEQVFGTETDNAADHRNPVVINWGGANEVTNDARLATINFSLKSDAQAGTYDFAVEVVEAFNDDNDWTLSVEKGQLTVTPNGGGEAATYAVTFNTNGGSEVPPQNVTSGGTASRPTPDPTRENYTFKNWYGDEALTTVFDFNTPITQPTTIYADWEEVSNPGPGQQNGATVVLGAAEVAQGDTQATVAVPISIRNNPGLLGLKVRVTYPEVLEVQNVAFEQVFGTETDNAADHRNPVVINWGGANEVTSDARLATINFSLKSDAQAGTYDFAVEVAEAFNDDNDWTLSVEKGQLTVTPPPQPQKVTVTFNGNGGTPATTTVEIDQGTTVTAPAQNPTRDGGYTFRGWFTSAAATQAFDFTAPVQSNTTVYAGWNDPQPQKVTVTFNGNGGTPATTEVEIDQGTTVTAPAQNPTREGGYTFRGWFADAAATQAFDFTAPIQNNTTVYAGWNDPVTPPTQKVTVTFNGNGGTPATTEVEIDQGTTVTAPAQNPTREGGYTFRGWFADAAATQAFDFTAPVQNNTTVYAGWNDPVTPDTPDTPDTPNPQPGGGGGCYIATSVYGSYDTPEVWTLRRFRDDVLGQTWYGRLFIKAYYATSPTLVRLFGDAEWFQNFWRDRLDSLVQSLQDDGFESTPYQDKDW